MVDVVTGFLVVVLVVVLGFFCVVFGFGVVEAVVLGLGFTDVVVGFLVEVVVVVVVVVVLVEVV